MIKTWKKINARTMDFSFKLIEYFLIIVGISYVLFEVVLNLNNIEGDTTNVILLEWSEDKFFFIPFALGAIGGHLFLGTKTPIFKNDLFSFISNGDLAVVVLFILAGIMVLIGYKVPFKKSKPFLTSIFILGILYGHFIWSMNY